MRSTACHLFLTEAHRTAVTGGVFSSLSLRPILQFLAVGESQLRFGCRLPGEPSRKLPGRYQRHNICGATRLLPEAQEYGALSRYLRPNMWSFRAATRGTQKNYGSRTSPNIHASVVVAVRRVDVAHR